MSKLQSEKVIAAIIFGCFLNPINAQNISFPFERLTGFERNVRSMLDRGRDELKTPDRVEESTRQEVLVRQISDSVKNSANVNNRDKSEIIDETNVHLIPRNDSSSAREVTEFKKKWGNKKFTFIGKKNRSGGLSIAEYHINGCEDALSGMKLGALVSVTGNLLAREIGSSEGESIELNKCNITEGGASFSQRKIEPNSLNIKSKEDDPSLKKRELVREQRSVPIRNYSQAGINRTELIFHEINENDIRAIKENKEVDAWLKGYIKASEENGINDGRKIGGYRIPKSITASSYKDVSFGDKNTIVIRAPTIGPGFDEIIIFLNGQSMSKTIAASSQDHKLFLVGTKFGASTVFTIRVENDGKLLHIYDEDVTVDALEIIRKCSFDTDYYKENAYKVMIEEGVANLNGYKVLDYRTGGAPAYGHTYVIKASRAIVLKELSIFPDMRKVKLPFKIKKPGICIATANISEATTNISESSRGQTRIECGCNIDRN